MKASIMVTSLLFGIAAAGTSLTAQAAPLGLSNLGFEAPSQAAVASNDLLIRISDDRNNLASDGHLGPNLSQGSHRSRNFTSRSSGVNKFEGQRRRFTRSNQGGQGSFNLGQIIPFQNSQPALGITSGSSGASKFEGQRRRFTRSNQGNRGSFNIGSFDVFPNAWPTLGPVSYTHLTLPTKRIV